MTPASSIRPLWCAAALACFSRGAAAQSRQCAAQLPASAASARWPSPLDRTIDVDATVLPLGDALVRVGAAARVRISYSPELLAIDRSVCLAARHAALGDVLVSLAGTSNVAPVVASSDQVVLAPATQSRAHVRGDMLGSLGLLDGVVVTSNAESLPVRGSPMAIDVVSGRQLARTSGGNLAAALDGFTAGMWTWPQSPANMLSAFASIRGASSFGVSYPKIYVDGIEVANPLIVSEFSPDAIERVEIVRGPQGSATYGTDATSGVINVITRHEGAESGGQSTALHTSAGLTQGTSARGVLRQEHALSIATGSSTRSADLYVSGGTLGDFVPNGASHDLVLNGSARRIGDRTTLSATARYFMESAGSARSALNAPIRSAMVSDTSADPMNLAQSVGEYTFGVTGSFAPSDRWTHTIVAGVDGYSLANVQTSAAPIPTAADSALRAAQGSAARATLRLSSVLRTGGDGPLRGTFTFVADHSALHSTATAMPDMLAMESSTAPALSDREHSTGAGAEMNVSFDEALYLTGALRMEHDSRLPAANHLVTLPMLGLALVRDAGPLTVTVRGSYGRGVRPVRVPAAQYSQFANRFRYAPSSPMSLGAEVQSGTEAGVDLSIGRALTVRMTRFDQRASGLLQQVIERTDTTPTLHRTYGIAGAGAISNRGWELEASATRSHLTASGTLTLVDSRVTAVAADYTGELRAGDRMLAVPASTSSLDLTWLGRRWSFSAGGALALDWINYDQLALAGAIASGEHTAHELAGPLLRQYWKRYDGGVRLRASVARDIGNRFALELTGDNLLNYQRGEPDDATIVPGQTIMTGLRMKF